MKPQLQVGHWYLVHADGKHTSIRAYMEDGWYPRDPWPTKALCEMGRVGIQHPDNVELPDEPDVSEIDRAIIEHHYPAAKTHPLIAGGIYNMAMGLCLANGKEWDWEKPDADPKHHADYLVIACSVLTDMVGPNGVVRDITDMEAASGPLMGWFRPRKWPSEAIPGAVPIGEVA